MPRILCLLGDESRSELTDTLVGESWEFYTARTTAEAQAQLRQHPPDLVILDSNFPGPATPATSREVLSLISRIKSEAATQAVSVLLLGSAADCRTHATGSAPDLCLELPVAPAIVISAVHLLLRHTQLGLDLRASKHAEADLRRALGEEGSSGRKRAEQAREHAMAELNAILRSMTGGLVVYRPDGSIALMNPAARRMLGYPPGFENRPLPERAAFLGVHHENGTPCTPEQTPPMRALSGETADPVAMLLRRADGRDVWIFIGAAPMVTSQGEQIGAVAVFSDITERKRIEGELGAARESAERAKGAAEAANEAKDAFLAVLSHELRNPLSPIIPAVTVLQSQVGSDESARELLELIRRNVELEARLIDDLLDVTRISRGKVELNRTRVELGGVIERAVEVCRPDIEARGLHFGVDWGKGPYWAEADAARLQQVFWNLLKNAIKFTPPGGCVGISLREVGGFIRVEIMDSGIGIEPHVLPRLFNAFEQISPHITRRFGGLGLGLAISKAMAESHGGTIGAESLGVGRGTTFRVLLPLVGPAPAPEPATTAGRSGARPLRILLVEDHGDTAAMLRMILQAAGHQVRLAGDVAGALAEMEGGAFDLLLSDLGLPDGSGIDLMVELRARGHRVPAIALSGYGQEEDLRRSREAGFRDHLVKPPDPERLLERIAAVAEGG